MKTLLHLLRKANLRARLVFHAIFLENKTNAERANETNTSAKTPAAAYFLFFFQQNLTKLREYKDKMIGIKISR
ncbi:MAG: hypothetical protein CVU91_05930 [Firmicutes bacterium HGW-Firmicutes-16]|nr:MAG: hypothetical protein CVU91_05930 [Firmicutes bacterium HGW-Firmicutes-16]